MSNVILHASCHVYSKFDVSLTGGTIPVIPPEIPISVPMYSSTFVNQINNTNVLKGGGLDKPVSILGYNVLEGGDISEPLTGAISNTTDGICADYAAELDEIMADVSGINEALDGPFKSLSEGMNALEGVAGSGVNEMDEGLGAISNTADERVPGTPNVDDIENLMKQCMLLENDLISGIKSPFGAASDWLDKALSDLITGIHNTLQDLEDLIESPIALLIDQINKIIASFGVNELLDRLDKLINCLESVCGRNFDTPSVPNINSSDFPTVQGYENIDSIEGYPNVAGMLKNPNFNDSYQKVEDIVSKKLPDVESFETIKVPDYPDIPEIPGYPYVTDMKKVPQFNEVYEKLKKITTEENPSDESFEALDIEEYPGVQSIEGYPDIAEMKKTPAFEDAYAEARKLAQTDQGPYLDFTDKVIDYTNNLLTDMNLDDSGSFDLAAVTDGYNLEPEVVENINVLTDQIAVSEEAAAFDLATISAEMETVYEEALTPDPVVQTEKNYYS